MAFPNIFSPEVSEQLIRRINLLKPEIHPVWGKMDVSQMLAHCNVAYEMVYEDKHPKPGFFTKIILKLFVKKIVKEDKPYKRNSPTAPAFIIKEQKDFEAERKRLVNYILKTKELGENSFDNKISASFGKMTKQEWNNMFYKHLDHHLTQFGV